MNGFQSCYLYIHFKPYNMTIFPGTSYALLFEITFAQMHVINSRLYFMRAKFVLIYADRLRDYNSLKHILHLLVLVLVLIVSCILFFFLVCVCEISTFIDLNKNISFNIIKCVEIYIIGILIQLKRMNRMTKHALIQNEKFVEKFVSLNVG